MQYRVMYTPLGFEDAEGKQTVTCSQIQLLLSDQESEGVAL